jgi:hypothetical protein
MYTSQEPSRTFRFYGGVGGSWQTTYTAVPHYITSDARSVFLTTYGFSVFDLTGTSVRIEVVADTGFIAGRILYGI